MYYGTCWATQPTVTFGPQIRGKTVFTLILDEIIQKMDEIIITYFLPQVEIIFLILEYQDYHSKGWNLHSSETRPDPFLLR